MTSQTKAESGSHWDPLRIALRAQRSSVGNLSYAEIATRIAAARQLRGVDEHAARVPRSTVYDAFRLGRARINLALVHEIGAALDADPDLIESWIAACHTSSGPVSETTLPTAAPESDAHHPVPPASSWTMVALAVACIALNLLGRVVVDVLHLPFYLDMVGTAVAAFVLGPWRGAGVGAATNVLAAATSGWVSIPFAVVNVVGALVWGYGVHRWGWGHTLPRFFGLCLVVAAACSTVAVVILVLLFGGSVGQGQDTVTQTFVDLGYARVAAVAFSNLLTSTVDKLISGFTALVVVSALPPALRCRARLIPTSEETAATTGR